MDLVPYPISRCSARSKTSGAQCAKNAIPGGNVCYYHGGNAPQVRAKAKERIVEFTETAILGALGLINDQLSMAGTPDTNGDIRGIEFKDLLATVDKLIPRRQLLVGEATSRDDTSRYESVTHRLDVQLTQMGDRVMSAISENLPEGEAEFIEVEEIETPESEETST
jgi:hypothetical protein